MHETEVKAPQHALLIALEHGNILEVHQALARTPISKLKQALLAPSKKPEHQLRTPLMAAAASGDLVIFGECRLSLRMHAHLCDSLDEMTI